MNISTLAPVGLIAAGLLIWSAPPSQAQVAFGDDSSTWANDGECDDPRFVGEGMATILLDGDRHADATDCRTLFEAGQIALREAETATEAMSGGERVEEGVLAEGDETLGTGEFRDVFTFEGRDGELTVVDLRSSEFDTYLMVVSPSGGQYQNDDHEGDASRSLLSLPLDEAGTYTVTVTSYQPGETGSYLLRIQTDSDRLTSGSTERQGNLADGDLTLDSGEYFDSYEIEGRPGQRVTIDLRSNDFDTFVILVDPSGEQHDNDDAEDGDDVGHSHLDVDLAEAGTYEVIVTSYEVGEVGGYSLVIDQADVSGAQDGASRDVTSIAFGVSTIGELADGDLEGESGEYRDLYVFEGAAGDHLRVDLTSDEFDTYIELVTPSGDIIDNDDYEGSTSRSVVEIDLVEAGRYRVVATSYDAAETGSYRLLVDGGSSGPMEVAPPPTGGPGRTFGVFVGISDYPGDDNDLDFTADDAVRVHEALVRGGGMLADDGMTLTDGDATVAGLREAIDWVAGQAGPDDTFVLFYSGHGDRVPRASADAADPDAVDETIVLYDGSVSDDEMRAMLEPVRAGTTLVLLDSCFSGGFAKDVISVPGRMGMFSSEEDVTSQVAAKFRAGGYLSYFLDEAIGQRLADEDGDGVTALELSEYVHLRFRLDVKAMKPASAGDFVRTGGPQAGYQHLVVDRGSVGPYDVLFR